MPPFLPTKRLRDEAAEESPAHAPPAKRGRVAASSKSTPRKDATAKPKQSLSEALDDNAGSVRTIADRRKLLRRESKEDDSDSSHSSDDSDEFEDVPAVANHQVHSKNGHNHTYRGVDNEDTDGSDEMEWEDAVSQSHHTHGKGKHRHSTEDDRVDTPIGDISISLPAPGAAPVTDGNLDFSDARGVMGKKGPSKIERQIRQNTHCMHVQFLMFHNTIRNAWCQDKEVQDILVGQLPKSLQREVARWNKVIGGGRAENPDGKASPTNATKGRGKTKGKSRGKSRQNEEDERALRDLIPVRNEQDERALRDRIRDWGAEAEPLENGEPDLSRGDPTIQLLRFLTAYWRKRFLITAPSLHKHGYLGPKDLESMVKAWTQDPDDAERFGETIKSKADFRQAAKKCEGSRDVGAQLFTALLRGIGLQTRMVVSLQPVGFGFGKVEDGVPIKKSTTQRKPDQNGHAAFTPSALGKGINMKKTVRQLKQTTKSAAAGARKSTRGSTNTAPISLDTSSSDELSDAPSDLSDDLSVVDVTPSRRPTKAYDAPPVPTYWTEVLSPITHSFIPVVSLPQPLIANSPELLASFTPSGKTAEKSKQVLAYVVAYNADGTAKDVTVRYLKKKQWPGKTRGVRVAKEKLPIYNKRGKVKKWIEWDWFNEVMSGYVRDPRLSSTAEQMEDEVDLVPVAATKKEEGDTEDGKGNVGGKPESLQAYKNSAEYVLERHLRREEAILPDSQPVRHFTTGKGENAKSEPVYRRSDVVTGMTVESWHKQGRSVKEGEQPIKMVPIRAVTLIRKREVEDAARETGEKPMQGLYSEEQTDWIIPDPIGPDRKIPKNAFGNIDIYVPSMVPDGAVHVRLKGTAKLCKKLEIDFAEAVTGFEFGKQRAVPVITGVVVAEEHEGIVKDAWRAEQQRVKERERVKKQAACLATWKKFLNGLKIMERMKGEYGHLENKTDEVNPWMNKKAREQKKKKANTAAADDEPAYISHDKSSVGAPGDADEHGGGFFPEGMEVEELHTRKRFPSSSEPDEVEGGFLLDGNEDEGDAEGEDATNGISFHTATPFMMQNGGSTEDEPADVNPEPNIGPDVKLAPSSKEPKQDHKASNKPSLKKNPGLSKRVAEARKFDEDFGDSALAETMKEPITSPLHSSNSRSPSGDKKLPKKRSGLSRAANNDKRKTKQPARSTPRRKASNGVRSRYFESDGTD